MNKTRWTVLLVIVLVAVGGVWRLYSSLDAVVAAAIRSYGPEITGVSVLLESVKIQPTDGVADLRGLELGNPPGFKTTRALSMGKITMKLNAASVTKDVVHVKEILIEAPEISYEAASGGSNLDAILQHVDAYIVGKTGAPMAGTSQGKETKVRIDHLYVKGAYAQVHADALRGKTVRVPVPDLHLTDIGGTAKGVSPAEVTREMMQAIIQSVRKAVVPLRIGGAQDHAIKGAAIFTSTPEKLC